MKEELKIRGDWRFFLDGCHEIFDHNHIFEDYARRFSFGTDASFYRLVPKLVVKISDENHLAQLFGLAQQFNVPLILRAACTSLSGQAATDSVLMLLEANWNQIKVLEGGKKITLQSGVIGTDANKALAPLNRKIGPDTASINTCRIGGIVANNSSGMCCGTAHNSHNTLVGIRIMLADGNVLDTRVLTNVAYFRLTHQYLLAELETLGNLTKNNTQLADKIQHKYRLKNTTGYSLNALIDYQDPIDMFAHLMVGSEGTLGFILEVTFDTVPEHPYRAVSLVLFRNMEQCCWAVTALKKAPVAAVELIDSRSLAAVAGKSAMPLSKSQVAELGIDAAALLVETRSEFAEVLEENVEQLLAVLKPFQTALPAKFSNDSAIIQELWAIRKGLFPSLGAVRKTGTKVIIEDVSFPIASLAAGVRDLQKLFSDFDYDEALLFDHALDGNLHFVFAQSFETEQEQKRYQEFTDAVCHLVALDYQGSLKAEQGTGRNMAPYVGLKWGEDAYQLMKHIKQVFDPQGILNPGVILNEDPVVHLKNLKVMPAAHELIDKCIECGFVEPVCPSRNLSLTPRQRIALYRNIVQKRRDGESPAKLQKLLDDFTYLGVDTCAATGLCEDRCPVGINTGELVKVLREEKNAKWQSSANLIGRHFGGVTKILRAGLKVSDVGHRVLSTFDMSKVTGGLRTLSGNRISFGPQLCRERVIRLS